MYCGSNYTQPSRAPRAPISTPPSYYWKLEYVLDTALCVVCIASSASESQDDSKDRLYSAIRANDLRQIKALLDEGASANAEGPGGITPLMVAAETGSLEAMKMLIDRRADVNARNTFGSHGDGMGRLRALASDRWKVDCP